jgi:hypothetical protein
MVWPTSRLRARIFIGKSEKSACSKYYFYKTIIANDDIKLCQEGEDPEYVQGWQSAT